MIDHMLSDKAIEEYQLILMRNPSAKVFAPLSEAYRKMGLLQQANDICKQGTRHNPEYPSGLVAYGKVLFELKKYEEAAKNFHSATELKPDNILAHKLKALSLAKLNNYAEALKAYKNVLLLNPDDQQAQKFISNWEYLEATNFNKSTFDVDEVTAESISTENSSQVSAFVEALIARNELAKAEKWIQNSLKKWPSDPLLNKQLQVVNEFQSEESRAYLALEIQVNTIKKDFYSRILRRIELGKKIDR